MYISYIFIIGLLITPATALATGLSRSDIADHPEAVCILVGDEPEMKDLCDWINICDDTGEINSTDQFCTGDAVRSISGIGCPKGFHGIEGDETGQCYSNKIPCDENDYKILQQTPSYPGEYYCDNLPPS